LLADALGDLHLSHMRHSTIHDNSFPR
jgi:hypothetical protein